MSSFLGAVLGFVISFCLLLALKGKLPTDIGRAYAVNAAAAKGKPRGAGIIFVPVFVVISLVFVPFRIDYLFYCLAILAAMVSGFLDDASRAPWSELKKGLIDLAISLAIAVVYVVYNGSDITFLMLGKTVTLPAIVYIILGTILVWASINVTNCTDGVDGLSSSLAIVSLLGFSQVLSIVNRTDYKPAVLTLAGCLMAYLLFNCSPSILLMGDAGSRAIGVFFAIISMKTGSPLIFLALCLIFIVDGGLGLIKVALLRYLKIKILVNVRTPIHDHFRKKLEWKDQAVVTRFVVIHALIVFTTVCLISL